MSKERFEVKYLPPVDYFIEEIGEKNARKLFYNISLARDGLDPRLFKKLDSVLWEFRAEYGGVQFRLLAFWDKRKAARTLVVATHGFIKKTDKIPSRELERAYNLREKYLNGEYD